MATKTEKEKDDERRVRLVYLDCSIWFDLLIGRMPVRKVGDCLRLPVADNLPDDVTVKSIHFVPDRMAWAVWIHSKEFEVVAAGSLIPEMELWMSTYKVAVEPKEGEEG